MGKTSLYTMIAEGRVFQPTTTIGFQKVKLFLLFQEMIFTHNQLKSTMYPSSFKCGTQYFTFIFSTNKKKAGQERFAMFNPAYYRSTHAYFLVYDITNRNSFEKIRYWINEISSPFF